ncbi:8-amino-7-oxononanoate synthase [Tundrisphaera lichenicola]|uniref:8-amino-7-oxononanoate synthase n=1 Tax=Tundrisphaera lichenicola TaxID=2029860 RepID=UPI003EBBEBA2
MIDPLAWIDEESRAWSRKGLERRLIALGGSTPGHVDRQGRSLVNFASNDYLGLASDPRVIEAATLAASRFGWGAGASPLVSGWREPHEALVEALSRFEGSEAVALFPSGYAANLGTIAALVGSGDAVYSDRLNHASLIDGARLSGARLRVYPHNDSNRLESILGRDRGRFRRSLIATDGVFSMDGDLAPLGDLADLAGRFGAMFLVDEAHGTGVYGAEGRGSCEALGVEGRVDLKVGTLSKALGSAGGFVAGSSRLIGWLVNHARTMIYSTNMPPPVASAALRALEIAREETWRRTRVLDLAKRLRGAVPGAGRGGPIVPVVLGDPARAVEMANWLLERGLMIPAIRPPTVPEGTARLRVSLTAAHDGDDLDRLLDAFGEAGLISAPGVGSSDWRLNGPSDKP